MLVRSVKNEIINLDLYKEFSLNENTLVVKDGDRNKIYTLTKESRTELEKYLTQVR
jgi:hypothetical protein